MDSPQNQPWGTQGLPQMQESLLEYTAAKISLAPRVGFSNDTIMCDTDGHGDSCGLLPVLSADLVFVRLPSRLQCVVS